MKVKFLGTLLETPKVMGVVVSFYTKKLTSLAFVEIKDFWGLEKSLNRLSICFSGKRPRFIS